MATDPICGMDVQEKDARYFVHLEHEAIYFCSSQCKEDFAHKTKKKKGFLARFLEKLAKDNENMFGGSPPTCH